MDTTLRATASRSAVVVVRNDTLQTKNTCFMLFNSVNYNIGASVIILKQIENWMSIAQPVWHFDQGHVIKWRTAQRRRVIVADICVSCRLFSYCQRTRRWSSNNTVTLHAASCNWKTKLPRDRLLAWLTLQDDCPRAAAFGLFETTSCFK